MKRTSLVVMFLAFLIALSLFVSACAPAKKPIPNPNQNPNPNLNPRMDTRQNNNVMEGVNNVQARAEKIARACDTVSGVENSTVVISGNTCYVGLDIKGNLENQETKRVERAVTEKALAADPGVKRCVIASDADTVSRLKDIYQGIRRGTPLSTFGKELEEIGRRVTPKVNP